MPKKPPSIEVLDRTRIDLNESSDVHYWCRILRVKPKQLRAAARRVGVMVADLRRELNTAG